MDKTAILFNGIKKVELNFGANCSSGFREENI